MKGYEGEVEFIGLRSTKLRLSSGLVVTIANAEMASVDSENISRRSHLQQNQTIELDPETPPERFSAPSKSCVVRSRTTRAATPVIHQKVIFLALIRMPCPSR